MIGCLFGGEYSNRDKKEFFYPGGVGVLEPPVGDLGLSLSIKSVVGINRCSIRVRFAYSSGSKFVGPTEISFPTVTQPGRRL